MSIAAWRTPRFAISARRWRALPMAGVSSPSPARTFAPDDPAWTDAFIALQERGTVVFTAPIAGAVYARHGTTIETRLTVIDKRPAADPAAFPRSPRHVAPDAATLLAWVMASVPPRLPVSSASASGATAVNITARNTAARPLAGRKQASIASRPFPVSSPAGETAVIELAYETADGAGRRRAASPTRSMNPMRCNRSGYRAPARIRPVSCSRRPWPRSRRPSRPIARIFRRASSAQGLLSDAQL